MDWLYAAFFRKSSSHWWNESFLSVGLFFLSLLTGASCRFLGTKTQDSEWLNTQIVFTEEISSQSSCVYICEETVLLCFTLTEPAIEKLKQKDTFKWMNGSLRGTSASSVWELQYITYLATRGRHCAIPSIHPSVHSTIRPFIHPSVIKVILESPVPQNRRIAVWGHARVQLRAKTMNLTFSYKFSLRDNQSFIWVYEFIA